MKSLYLLIFLAVLCQNSISVSEAMKIHSWHRIFFNYVRGKADDILDNAGGNTQCAQDLKSLFNDFIYMEKWALEMFDACSKGSSGVLAGNLYMTGNYDQCLNIAENKSGTLINGQYCTVVLNPSNKYSSDLDFLMDSAAICDFLGIKLSMQSTDIIKVVKMSYGLCIPDSCSIGNLQAIWDYVEHTFRLPVHVQFSDQLCRSKEKAIDNIFPVDKYIIGFFCIYAFVLLISTCYDILIHQHLEGREDNVLITFSVYSNGKKLFSPPKKGASDYIEAISGLKFISMLWVILGHRYFVNIVSGITNASYLEKWKGYIFTSFVLSGSYAVDTFLVLSGLLLSFGVLRYHSTRKNRQFSVISIYFYRCLRITPALLAIVLFYISIFKRLGDGPAWPLISKKITDCCVHTWWATLLFINNFLDTSHTCVEHSWYLSVDSQLFFVSPIILMNLIKRPWKTCLACVAACVASGLYTFIITMQNNYGAIYFEFNKSYQQYIYQPTFVRMPPWLIGFVFGFLIYKYRDMKIPKVANLIAWTFTLGLLFALIFVHLVFTRTHEYSALKSALFNSLARQGWAIGVGTVVLLCTTGNGGIINDFLSIPIFQILVRISYSVYLTHFPVLIYFIGEKKHPDHFSNIKSIHDFTGDLAFVFIVATVWCLAFESPFIAIAKIVFRKDYQISKTNVQMIERPKKNKKNKKKGYVVCVYKYEDENDTLLKKNE
ncbi:unnamed protein product [Phaedon cochleariae]|uniref:Nose resistant-to-fluoxetine protein N-terminal domain-containing protein n=1 Tax=Phaedon cochleariae TaxID=80249 RepID=A0A9N9SHL0_PHACE|nr:unnamed protein product [Phaedon cochleariae]